MSFSSEKSSRQTTTMTSLPRQDTATTVSSLSTSCSNLETNDSTVSSASTLQKSRKKTRRNSLEHFVPSSDPKTLKTLKVHYYPEEQSWSLVIIIVATIVHVINHGLHLAIGVFLVTISQSFNRVSLIQAGDFCLIFIK